VLPQSITYFKVYFYGAIAVVLYNISVGILQAVGDSRHPLYYLIFSASLNVALDLLFIGVFKKGVGAAAAATSISQGVSALLCLIRLLRTKEVYRVALKEIRFHKGMLFQILKYGLPSGVQNSVIAIANVIVQSHINAFGDNAMAACGTYSRVEGFAFLPITCFSMSLTTFIGQNLGAKQFDRAKAGAKFGIFCSVIMAEIIGVAIWLFAPACISLFTDSEEVIALGTRQARTESLFYCLLAFSHCIAGICRGAGKANVPMFIMLACWCVIRIIYISIAVSFIGSIGVIYWAYPITWGLSSVIFLVYYLCSDWVHAFERKEHPCMR
jgi:putative MATE family efflux protein